MVRNESVVIDAKALDTAVRRFPHLLLLRRRAVWHGEVKVFRVWLEKATPLIVKEYWLVLRETRCHP